MIIQTKDGMFKVKKMQEGYFKKRGREKVFSWIIFAIFTLYILSLIYPFAWLFMNSFRHTQAFGINPNSFAGGFTLENYREALRADANGASLSKMFFNSMLISTVSTLITVITSSCTAYIMSKFNFRGKGVLFSIIIFSMILPVVGTTPSIVRVFKEMGIFDSYFALFFLYSGGMGNNFILLYSFYKGISWEYAEAAEIDGASDFRIFISVMMPLALPAVTSIAVLTWIGLWNEYVMPRVLLPGEPTLSVGLYTLTVKLLDKNRPQLFAAVSLALIPIIAVFCVFQKTIMTNTVAGGLKG